MNILMAVDAFVRRNIKTPFSGFLVAGNARGCQVGTGKDEHALIMSLNSESRGRESLDGMASRAFRRIADLIELPLVVILMAIRAFIMFDLNSIGLFMAGLAIEVYMFSLERVIGFGMIEGLDRRDGME